MDSYIDRNITQNILQDLKEYPVVALLGPRQVGKSTLAKRLIQNNLSGLYLDLERPSQRLKLQDPESFLQQNASTLICFDEIQRVPEIFSLLRSFADERAINGQFLILGSLSRDLLKQSSQTLAGRMSYLEMTPLTLSEIPQGQDINLWLKGGLPRSFLSKDLLTSLKWRENYIRTFLERDIPQMGFNISSDQVGRLWRMLAHIHGQPLNASKLGSSLGVTSHTINSYIGILEQAFLLRVLQPLSGNFKKRWVKSPKIYIRDSGLLHSLLEIESMNDLLGHPNYGASFEGMVIEQIACSLPQWNFHFYQTKSGNEIDLVMTKGQRTIAIEIKANQAPKIRKGFWTAIEDIQATEKYLIASIDSPYPIGDGVMAMNIRHFLSIFK